MEQPNSVFQLLFNRAGAAIALINTNGTLSLINEEFENLSGYRKAEIEGHKSFLDFLAGENLNDIERFFQNQLSGGSNTLSAIFECNFSDRSGHQKVVNLTLGLIPEHQQYVATLADVTDIRDAQRKKFNSQHISFIAKLASAISHEIRNPLSAINTSVEILKDGLELSGQDLELLNIIYEETMRLNKLISDFLLFARLKEPAFSKTDINALINDTIFSLRDRFGTNIRKIIKLDETLPTISADPNQLTIVFRHIILNALEAMPDEGTLIISTRHINTKTGPKKVEVSFSDTGPGIDEEDLDKIFQPFFSNKVKSTGMGLSISHRIINNHEGDIKVTSKPGEGTTVTLTLPV